MFEPHKPRRRSRPADKRQNAAQCAQRDVIRKGLERLAADFALREVRDVEVPVEKIFRDAGERMPASAESSGGSGKGETRNPGSGQGLRGVPQADAFESRIVVARVADEGNG